MTQAMSAFVVQATRTLKALEVLLREATEHLKEERKMRR